MTGEVREKLRKTETKEGGNISRHLFPFQHVHLCACGGVRVEQLHLFVQLSLCAVQLGPLSLQVLHLGLQLVHVGVLHGALQLSLLRERGREAGVTEAQS